MSTLPIELWSLIASTNVQTYHVLVQVMKGLCKVYPADATSWEDHFTTMEVNEIGDQVWTLHGKIHRGGDQPAIIWEDGHQEWHIHGKLYRGDDKPAVIYADGTQIWVLDDKYHRCNNRPAVIRVNGSQEWWVDGKLIEYQEAQ